MPTPSEYAQGFGLTEGMMVGSYQLTNMNIEHHSVVQWNQYSYPTILTLQWKGTTPPTMEDANNLFQEFTQMMSGLHIIRSESQRPYKTMFQVEGSSPSGSFSPDFTTVMLHYSGYATRVGEAEAQQILTSGISHPTDEEVWLENIASPAFSHRIEVKNATDLWNHLSEMDGRYIVREPADLMVSASLKFGRDLNLSEKYDDYPFVEIESILVRLPRQGTGVRFMTELINLAQSMGYGVKLSGSYTEGGRRLAERSGMIQDGYYKEYIIPPPGT